jgi:hypothetical protein
MITTTASCLKCKEVEDLQEMIIGSISSILKHRLEGKCRIYFYYFLSKRSLNGAFQTYNS